MAIIELKPEEALVLLDLLIQFQESESLVIRHNAEKRVLWDLCATLESQVPEILSRDYSVQLERARDLVAGDEWE